MLLTNSPRRIFLMIFWIVLGVFGSIIVGGLFALLTQPMLGLIGVPVLMVWLALAAVRPPIVATVYKLWNRWALRYAKFALGILLLVIFRVMFRLVGLGGARFQKENAAESFWRARASLASDTFSSQSHVATTVSQRDWLRAYMDWAAHSNNLWAWALLPFLILLSLFEPAQETEFPANIYTLF